MSRKAEIICPQTGHGNPLTALAIGRILGDTEVVIYGGLGVSGLALAHQLMSRIPFLSRQYTERSEQLRGSGGAILIGALQLQSWLQSERLEQFKGQSLADTGIFVQEHLLGILPEELLKRWFPEGVFLYIPDVYPKESAVEILRKHQDLVVPLVWNQQARDELQKKGLNPVLCQPVLPFELLEEQQIIDKEKINPKKRVLKSSGSGIDPKLLKIVVESRQEGETLEIWLPDRVIVYSDSHPEGEKKEDVSTNLKDYGREFYQSLLDAGEIISYPSEMVQVVSSLLLSGWRGRFTVLPPRGAHEERNLEWLSSFLEPTIIEVEKKTKRKAKKGTERPYVFSVFDFSQPGIEEKIKQLKESLGSQDLISVIEANKKDLSDNLAISSEALKLPFIPHPAVKQEFVIASSEELTAEGDWDRVAGIHFRTGKRLEEEVFYQQLKEVIRIAGERGVGYVTIHLEDLPSDIDEARRRLTELNQLALEKNVVLLLENVAPRVDQELKGWQYSLVEFVREFRSDLAGWQNIGFCLDIAHLGLAEPEVLAGFLNKVRLSIENAFGVESRRAGDLPNLTEEEKILFERTRTIHWSRSRKGRNQKMFETFKRIASRIPKFALKIHQTQVLLENLLSAHYSLSSGDSFFIPLIILLQQAGWRGTIVIESPDVLEIIRERRFPHQKEIQALESLLPFVFRASLKYFFEREKIGEEDFNDLINFVFSDFENLQLSSRFLGFLDNFLPLIRSCYQDSEGEDFRRKVNRGLYIRHVLRAAVWGEVLFDDFVRQGLLREEEYEAFMLSIGLHDFPELTGVTKEQVVEMLKGKGVASADVIGEIVSVLTPRKQEDLTYQERKRKDFKKILKEWRSGNKAPLLVKITDILTNLDETIDDLEQKREDGRMRPLSERYSVWKERVGIIEEIFGQEAQLVQLLKERLKAIEDFLFWRVNDKINLNEERTKLLNEIRINRFFIYQWNGQEHQYNVDGIIVIEGRVYLARKVNSNTVEVLSFDDFCDWRESGFSPQKVPIWLKLCNNSREGSDIWTNSSYIESLSGNQIKIPVDSETGKRLTLIANL